MWNYLVEKFLTEYFLYEVTLNGYIDGQAVFNLLSEVFLLSDEERAFAGDMVRSTASYGIRTESDYMRYCRSKKYFAISGINTDIDHDTDTAITLKGSALLTAKNMDCAYVAGQTKLKVEEKLTVAATGGSIAAMRIAGVLLQEGIFFTQDRDVGLRYLRMAAAWNDIPSLMYALYYDNIYTRRYAGKLAFLLKNVSHSEIVPVIERRYGCYKYGENKEARLLEKLFQLKVLQREFYSPVHAKALFSKVISFMDKEKLLYTAGKDYLSIAGDLPLKLGGAGICGYDFSAFGNMPLKNKAEHSRIMAQLNNSDLRGIPIYRPLCLSCDSKYILQMYAGAIAQCAAGAHVEYIYMDEVNLFQFDHNKNNIFIRSCDEDRENIYLMFFTGDIADGVSEQARAFLKSDFRSRFHLNMPNINIDLSCILPVCFCDSHNEKQLRTLCDVVRIPDCADSEKPDVLQYMMVKESFLYDIPEIVLQDRLRGKLLALPVDDMAKELDVEVSLNRQKGVKLVLTEDNFTTEHSAAGSNSYGFRGIRNENN